MRSSSARVLADWRPRRRLPRPFSKVLVLERHYTLGGLTQTFSREGFTWGTGVHYIGGVGPEATNTNAFGRLLRWLSDDALTFAPIGPPYDIVRFPDEFSFKFEAPEAALVAQLKATFPDEADALDTYFGAVHAAQHAMLSYFRDGRHAEATRRDLRSLPEAQGGALGGDDDRDADRPHDPQPVARRIARGPLGRPPGIPPSRAPFPLHALVLGSYLDGAYYPVGGPARLAEALAASIRNAGGELRTSAEVVRILVERDRVTGVVLADGSELRAHAVISDMGAHNTVERLPAEADRIPTEVGTWRNAIAAIRPAASYIALYLGFEGDIRALGASAANV